jgi:hypothetical protein
MASGEELIASRLKAGQLDRAKKLFAVLSLTKPDANISLNFDKPGPSTEKQLRG